MKNKNLTVPAIICVFIFGLLPFLYLPVTQDPEITIRYLALTLFCTVLVGIMLYKKSQPLAVSLRNPVLMAFAMYVTFSGLSLFRTLNLGDGIYEISKLLICLLFLILLVQQLRIYPDWIYKIPIFVTFSSLGFATIGLFQLIPLVSHIFLDGGVFSIQNSLSSTLSNKNFFAETLLMSLPFSVHVLIFSKSYLRIVSLITLILSIMYIIIIQSASVYFALLVALIFTVLVALRYRKLLPNTVVSFLLGKTKLIIFFGILLISIPVAILLIYPEKIDYSQFSKKVKAINEYIQEPNKTFETDNKKNNNSVYDRLFLARNSLLLTKENPIFGNGIANWKILYSKYGMYGNSFMALGRLRFEHPHNDYLFIVSETGIAGLISWLTFLGLLSFIAFNNLKKQIDTKKFTLTLLMLFSLTSFICLSLFGYPKERFFTMVLLLFVAAMLLSQRPATPSAKAKAHYKYNLIILIGLITISWIQSERYRSEMYLYRAFLVQKNSDFPSMQRLLEKAKSPFQILDMTSTPLEWHLGQSYYYQGNHQQAFIHYEKAAEQNPYHMQVLNDLGALYEEKGDHVKAIEYFNRVFKINPDFPDTKMNMVAVYFNTGEIDKAFDLLKNHYYKYSKKWHENMNIVLMAKAEKFVQATQDTALAELLNKRIQVNPNYLKSVYSDAEKDSVTFEEKLRELH